MKEREELTKVCFLGLTGKDGCSGPPEWRAYENTKWIYCTAHRKMADNIRKRLGYPPKTWFGLTPEREDTEADVWE